MKCPRNGSCVGQTYTDETESFRRTLKGPLQLRGIVLNFLAGLTVFQSNSKEPDLNTCHRINGSEEVLCKNTYGGKEFLFQTILGKDCAIFRGQHITPSGGYNDVEQIVFYFPDLEWNEVPLD